MKDLKRVERFPGGVVELPSSKSVSHRALICAGLAHCFQAAVAGRSEITRISYSEDIDATIDCMRSFGCVVRRGLDYAVVENGTGAASETAGCGESGTTLRLLIPAASVLRETTVFTGRGRLMKRPVTPYADALEERGVSVTVHGDTLTVKGRLNAGRFVLPGDVSSQFISGLLLALPLLEGDSEIALSTPLQSASYVDLTTEVMARFGVTAEGDGSKGFFVKGGQRYRPASMAVEADYSHAAFFLVAGALGQPCELRGLSQNSGQGDRIILDILEQSGVRLATTPDGGIMASPGELRAQTVDISDIPDLAPPLAALFAYCDGESRMVNAGRLRYKESDRLSAITDALNGLGACAAVDGDTLVIQGKKTLRGGCVDSRGDHRIAMMGAVAAIRCEEPVLVSQSGCVAKSYPGFWEDFERSEPRHG